jgi:UBX domain-containing protein 1
MLVQDPTRRNDSDAIFEQARQTGAVQAPPPFLDSQSSSSRSFTGTGRLLSGETTPSAALAAQEPVHILHVIHLWNNGFSVDDGPLRAYDDPENADFIEVISFYMLFLDNFYIY